MIFKTSKKINKLFNKFSKLIHNLDKNEEDFIKNFVIFDYESAIKSVQFFAKICEKSQKNNLPIFYTKNSFDDDHYCYLFIGNEKEIIAKIQSGIDQLLVLQKKYKQDNYEYKQIAQKKEITVLKAKIKKLERQL